MKILIYSTPACPYCIQAKKYFKEKNLEYEDINVSTDQDAAEDMVKLSGQMGVPVIKIDDKIIIGFDSSEIENILNKK
ncbi:MAG: Glutaredoxin-like protein, YruB-family [Candidatus Berkelbacteria bacterium]|nr:Glutaredoxin-like protein, YruB-family [Candidatus Berkelbacteria bacterium]